MIVANAGLKEVIYLLWKLKFGHQIFPIPCGVAFSYLPYTVTVLTIYTSLAIPSTSCGCQHLFSCIIPDCYTNELRHEIDIHDHVTTKQGDKKVNLISIAPVSSLFSSWPSHPLIIISMSKLIAISQIIPEGECHITALFQTGS